MPASTVTEYLAALPADRREALNEVRRGINRSLPPGYKEGIQFGMISWFVPLSTYPAGYGGNPKDPCPSSPLRHRERYGRDYSRLSSQTNSPRRFRVTSNRLPALADIRDSRIS